jgi:hypothetical protein
MLLGISVLNTWLTENTVFVPKRIAAVFNQIGIFCFNESKNNTGNAQSITPKSP